MTQYLTIFLLSLCFFSFIKWPKTIPLVLTLMYLTGLGNFLPRVSGISFSLFLICISVFVWFIILSTRQSKFVFFKPQSTIILIYFLIDIVASVVTGRYTLADPYLRGLITNILYFFVIINLLVSSKDIEKIISLIPWILLIHLVFIFLPYSFFGESYQRHSYAGIFRIDSVLLSNPNAVSYTLSFFLPIIYYFTKYGDSIGIRNLSKLVFFLSFVAIILSISRTGFLMLLVFLLWLFRQHGGWQKKVLAVAVISVVAIGIVGESYKTRILTMQEGIYAAKGRTYRWEVALESIRDHPLLGIGPAGMDRKLYRQYATRVDDAFIHKIDSHGTIHNTYLMVMMHYGIPIFIFYMSIFYFTFKDLVKMKKDYFYMNNKKYELLSGCIFCSFIIYLIEMMFTHAILDKNLLLFIGIVLLMKNIARQNLIYPQNKLNNENVINS